MENSENIYELKKGDFAVTILRLYRAILTRHKRYNSIAETESLTRNYRRPPMDSMLKVIHFLARRNEAKEIAGKVEAAVKKVDKDYFLRNRYINFMAGEDLKKRYGIEHTSRVYREIDKRLNVLEDELAKVNITWKVFAECESSIGGDIRDSVAMNVNVYGVKGFYRGIMDETYVEDTASHSCGPGRFRRDGLPNRSYTDPNSPWNRRRSERDGAGGVSGSASGSGVGGGATGSGSGSGASGGSASGSGASGGASGSGASSGAGGGSNNKKDESKPGGSEEDMM